MTDDIDKTQAPSFDEFSAPTYDEWRATAEASLKGASFDKKLTSKTYEGITLQPLYFQENTVDLTHAQTLPGFPPYVRGTRATGYLVEPWHIAQEITYGLPEQFNAALLHDLERGQTAINLIFDEPTRNGFDPDQSEMGKVCYGGLSIATLADLETALKGVDLENTPIMMQVGASAVSLTAFLIALFRKQGKSTEHLHGSIETDPLGSLAQSGTLPVSMGRAYESMAELTRWAKDNAPRLKTVGVNVAPYHNAGANAVQEIAFALATGVSYIREMQERDLDIETICNRIQFTFALGGNFFMELAKLRAARLLWAQVVEAFGGSADAQKMAIHARTAIYNKTVNDPYVNMLRTTTEALSGAIGGVDSLSVAPFDDIIRQPDEFSRRIARNQQLILQREVALTRLIDPAGGSWYVEYLTDQLAQRGWQVFQEIEADGGMLAGLVNETVQQQIGEVAEARKINATSRKDRIVGTNMYANPDEKPLPDDKLNYAEIHRERSEAVRQQRKDVDIADGALETLVDAALSGTSLRQMWDVLLRDFADETPIIAPLRSHRRSEPFEQLREAVIQYTAKNGTSPKIFLANMGTLAKYKARADFTTGFFTVGGFDLVDQGGYETPEDAADAALNIDAIAVVICSTDADYPEVVPPLVERIKAQKPEMMVILAGYPVDQIEAHKAAGVDEFIHIKANCYEINRKLQEKMGVVQ